MAYNYDLDPEYVPPYTRKTTDMSVGAWVGTLILTMIPIVGFICLIVWAVSSSPEKRSRKNWAIAQFIIMLISVILVVAVTVIYGSAFLNLIS